jgi:hypothetical protein
MIEIVSNVQVEVTDWPPNPERPYCAALPALPAGGGSSLSTTDSVTKILIRMTH